MFYEMKIKYRCASARAKTFSNLINKINYKWID